MSQSCPSALEALLQFHHLRPAALLPPLPISLLVAGRYNKIMEQLHNNMTLEDLKTMKTIILNIIAGIVLVYLVWTQVRRRL